MPHKTDVVDQQNLNLITIWCTEIQKGKENIWRIAYTLSKSISWKEFGKKSISA